ncbi:hypothetical protein Acr_10g0006940 [Actinidia rufa]|uniref:Uncharacterized protein n=1 Tax=Actinidia rufa TaxID=165716 RepID=A0A7J0FAT7_9ERIC|nr:hypothetical protein Acr_10g0006940 [Actinidia rufa]
MSIMEAKGLDKKSKSKRNEKVDYDSSRFAGKVEEKLYNRVWVQNGAVIEQELDLVTLENAGIKLLQNFMSKGWISLTMFKAESILTLCQEFMVNIKCKSATERGKERARLLWAIGTGKIIDLPRMMFMSLCATHMACTRFLIELFTRSGVHISVDLIKIEPQRPIDRSSLSRSDGQRKKRRLEAIEPEEPLIRMTELKEIITNLRTEMSTHMTALEEESGCHTTMLQ